VRLLIRVASAVAMHTAVDDACAAVRVLVPLAMIVSKISINIGMTQRELGDGSILCRVLPRVAGCLAQIVTGGMKTG
jgi:hypothetical protein